MIFSLLFAEVTDEAKKESGDIDILLAHPTYTSEVKNKKKHTSLLKAVIKQLEEENFITDTISHGEFKFMGVCQLNNEKPYRRIDIRLAPYDQYYCAVLYFTGSDMFNKEIRTRALEKRYTLNEYTLKKLTPEGTPGDAEKIISEEDIFKILDLPYKKPEQRNV